MGDLRDPDAQFHFGWATSRVGGWEMGKWRIKHYLLILNICSLPIGELGLAKSKTKSHCIAFLSDSYICWFFHWHPAFGVSIFLIWKQQRAVIAHVWIQHSTSMFSYREIILCEPATHQSHSGGEWGNLYTHSLVDSVTTDCTSPFPSWLPPFPKAQRAAEENMA